MYTKWIYKNIDNISEEAKKAVNNDLIAKLLTQRGIDSKKRLDDFLKPLKMSIISPYKFKYMEKAVARIAEAIEKNELILIWGDFDADGVTATSVLYKTLKFLGANVDYYIPSRETENHGLNTKTLVKLISKRKMKLLITVDCGISNLNEVNFLKGFKVDTIISDHHDFSGKLPEAYAIINPKVQNNLAEDLSVDEIAYLSYLAGVGVAFKIACALLEKYGKNDFIDEVLPYVAVGTVADVVPLIGENRCYVVCGLKLIEQSKNAGIAKLLEVAGFSPATVNSETIAFGLAPRINAAGRLKTADLALKLLLSDNMAEIDVAANELNNLNKIRQELCDQIFSEAEEQIRINKKQPAIVLYNSDWNIGIIGIVASKIVEKYNKPTFLLCCIEDDPNTIRCSARGVDGLNLYEIIKENENLLLGFGGHKLAAGLSFDKREHSFEEIKKALCATVAKASVGLDLLPKKFIDLELLPKDLNFEFIETINMLQPFGAENEYPLFSLSGCSLKSFKQIGANANHSKMMISKEGQDFEAVYWNNTSQPVQIGEKLDLAFYPKINEFNSKKIIQLDIQDLHWEGCEKQLKEESDLVKIYDHRQKNNIFKQVDEYLCETTQNVVVFAQEKGTVEALEKYENLAQKIKNKNNLDKTDQIMFFDYPANEEEFRTILDEACADKIHFMCKNYVPLNSENLLKTLSGMCKYVANNKDGILDIDYISCILGITNESVQIVLKLFVSCGIINIEEFQDNVLRIKFIEPKGLNVIKNSEYYARFAEIIQNINKYREYLLNCDIEEIENFVKQDEIADKEPTILL